MLLLESNHQTQEIVNKICASGCELGIFGDAASIADALKTGFLKEKMMVAQKVYINWHRFDKIDQMQFPDLMGHFDDIWYPGADDIDIFDDSLNWVASVSHFGNVRLLKWS